MYSVHNVHMCIFKGWQGHSVASVPIQLVNPFHAKFPKFNPLKEIYLILDRSSERQLYTRSATLVPNITGDS
jgi:hypothetical protein